jgi:glycosyltransferase involved in cell wall biosynthesis
MKVAYLIHSYETNGPRYRVLQYLPYVKQAGIETSVHCLKRTWREKLAFYRTLDRYDVFYIHRKLFLPFEFWLIRRRARTIVYDFDDAIMYRSSGAKSPHSFSRRLRFEYMMKRVDGVIAGNRFLGREALTHNPNVEVVPTAIDLTKYRLKPSTVTPGAVTIGWLGSRSTLKYVGLLKGPLGEVYRRCPEMRFKMVCDRFAEGLGVPVVEKRWAEAEEEADLQSFDIGVMPLADDLWSRGKCGLKILQYYGVGVPVVCTPVGVNEDIVEDGVNGFWARTEEEWADRLLRLGRDPALRHEMGLKGRKKVEEAYSVEANAPRIIAMLKRLGS